MKKLLVISLSVALTIISANTAFSNTQPQKPENAEVVKAELETPLCYLQTPDGKTWNLNSLCEQTPKDPNSSPRTVAVTNPYNNTAIKKFDEDLYGEGN